MKKLSTKMIAALSAHDATGQLRHCDLGTRKALEARGLVTSETHLSRSGEYTYRVSVLTDAGRLAVCSHETVIELADGAKVCTACEAVTR